MTYHDDVPGTLECIRRVKDSVDDIVISIDESVTDDQKEQLKAQGGDKIHLVYSKFESMPEQRNAYLEKAKELGADWICVSDADEYYNDELCQKLRQIIEDADQQGYNQLGLHCVEQFETVEWMDNLDRLKETPWQTRESNFFKNLIFKNLPGLRYYGIGKEGKTHETWHGDVPWRPANLPKRFNYQHVKSPLRIWMNAARNLYLSGGGNNVGDLNPFWTELRQICEKEGISSWHEFREYLDIGEVSSDFDNWLFRALWATPTDYGTETRETAKYFYSMHPERVTDEVRHRLENPPELPPEEEVRAFVRKCYFECLGRHPDESGLEHYAKAIMDGRLTREQLPELLKQSPEYRQKFGEQVRVQVPVDVNVSVDSTTYLQAFQKSRTFRQVFAPRFDIGRFLEQFIDKEAFYREFYQQANLNNLTFDGFVRLLQKHRRES